MHLVETRPHGCSLFENNGLQYAVLLFHGFGALIAAIHVVANMILIMFTRSVPVDHRAITDSVIAQRIRAASRTS